MKKKAVPRKYVRAYHFVGCTLRDDRPIPADGEWLEHTGPLVMCKAGLHASEHPYDALAYAPGATLCLVDLDGEIIRDTDKMIASRRRIVKRIYATSLLRQFARQQALSVIHLWDAPDVDGRRVTPGRRSGRRLGRRLGHRDAFARLVTEAFAI